ncbi:hypothetical protein CERZMDRAFT_83847 [Cercospora zeae-maydis SCOH1-5]|uniref:Uncharacterized protein n=1 Tax=Cercospora zeae-maydis SCOH1-5 TaxID=717836 RepID=A0A6A6FK26_9PEZI|nr:hypothetical protein CERZMDRAFT_83847 [Cercospora zeae-maydis SCOH1-5]
MHPLQVTVGASAGAARWHCLDLGCVRQRWATYGLRSLAFRKQVRRQFHMNPSHHDQRRTSPGVAMAIFARPSHVESQGAAMEQQLMRMESMVVVYSTAKGGFAYACNISFASSANGRVVCALLVAAMSVKLWREDLECGCTAGSSVMLLDTREVLALFTVYSRRKEGYMYDAMSVGARAGFRAKHDAWLGFANGSRDQKMYDDGAVISLAARSFWRSRDEVQWKAVKCGIDIPGYARAWLGEKRKDYGLSYGNAKRSANVAEVVVVRSLAGRDWAKKNKLWTHEQHDPEDMRNENGDDVVCTRPRWTGSVKPSQSQHVPSSNSREAKAIPSRRQRVSRRHTARPPGPTSTPAVARYGRAVSPPAVHPSPHTRRGGEQRASPRYHHHGNWAGALGRAHARTRANAPARHGGRVRSRATAMQCVKSVKDAHRYYYSHDIGSVPDRRTAGEGNRA